MVMFAGKKPPASTPYHAQRRDGALSLTIGCSTRHWLDPFVRVKSSLWLKIHGPSERELTDKRADHTRYVWTSQRRRRHSSTTTLDSRYDTSTRHYHRQPLRRLQYGECSTPCRKTPHRRSRAEEKQVSVLVPYYLLPPFSRFVDMW